MSKIVKVAISGKMCTGKTTTADNLTQEFEEAGFIVERVSLAEPLKRVAAILWPEKMKAKDRKMLTDLGGHLLDIEPHLFGRLLMEHVNTRITFWKMYWEDGHEERPIAFILDDLRLPYEAAMLTDDGWTMVRLKCDRSTQRERFATLYKRPVTMEELTHYTEVAIDHVSFHVYVDTTRFTPYKVIKFVWAEIRERNPWMLQGINAVKRGINKNNPTRKYPNDVLSKHTVVLPRDLSKGWHSENEEEGE